MSRGFVCALFGIGMTLLAWYGPWSWPAWPAFTIIDLFFGGQRSFAELSYGSRSVVLVALILVNSGFWAFLAAAAHRLAQRRRK